MEIQTFLRIFKILRKKFHRIGPNSVAQTSLKKMVKSKTKFEIEF
jgi:hypothetical protein